MKKVTGKALKFLRLILSVFFIVVIVFAVSIYCGNRDSLIIDAQEAGESAAETDLSSSEESESLDFETAADEQTSKVADKATEKKETKTAAPATTTAAAPPKRFTLTSQFSKGAYINSVVKLTNDNRRDAGAEKLRTDVKLMNAAQTRAEECASIDSIRVNGASHKRPDGSEWYTVLGVSENYNYGENTGQGCDTPEYMMEVWLNSKGHKANILNEDYTKIGVGCAVSSGGTVFCVQIFYRP